MNALRKIFVVLAMTCGASWLLKMAFIAAGGGAEADGFMIGALWATGMLTFLLAAAAGAALLTRRWPSWLRVLAAIAAVPVGFVFINVLDTAIKAVYESDGWFRDEVALVVGGVAMAAMALQVLRRDGGRVGV